MNSVSVIIPNYNGKSLLQKYLPYVFAALNSCRQVKESEVIVVDDASTDDSVTYISATYPCIKLLRNKENRGFSVTVNKGIRAAQYEAACILNTDMQLPEDYFTVLLPMLKADDVFGVYCAIRDPHTGKITEGRKQAVIRRYKLDYIDLLGEDEEGESMYLCGGNALINREKLLLLGGYDELFSPFYFEDMDLSLRAQKRGWRSLYTARTSCIHQHTATIGNHFLPAQIEEVFLRNRVYINARNLGGVNRLCFILGAYFHLLQEIILQKQYRPYQKALKVLYCDKTAEKQKA